MAELSPILKQRQQSLFPQTASLSVLLDSLLKCPHVFRWLVLELFLTQFASISIMNSQERVSLRVISDCEYSVFADVEVQRMKKAMESLMAANEEKVQLPQTRQLFMVCQGNTEHSVADYYLSVCALYVC